MQPVGHSDYVLQQLCSQLEYGFLCDCSIAVGDVHFRAHRVVLAACSSYFHKLFVNQPADSSRLALSTQAVSPEHFDLILQLMYTGRLPAPPADPERFRASLSFLKLYNAGWFPDSAAADHASAAEERDKGDGDASGPSEPLVFCVQLCQDEGLGAPTATAADRPPEAAGRSYPDAIKAEAPEGERQQPFLCHQCGLDFEEHRQLRDHLRMHAQQPFRCPLCGLAFERPLTLQEHMAGCLRGRAAEEEEPSPRAGGGGRPCLANGGARAAAAISKASGPGLRTPKPEEPLPPVGLSGVAVACVGSPGASSPPPPPVLKRPKLEEPEPTPPPLPGLGAPEPEDYELEEGEVRFPGLDNLVLQNDISADDDDDDDSFSSFDSSLDGDSAGEPSDDEGVPGGAGDKVPAVGGGGGGGGLAGRPACQTCCVFRSGEEERCHGARHLTTRRLGKAWRCRACEACRPAVKQPKGPPGNRAGGATRGKTKKSSRRRAEEQPAAKGARGRRGGGAAAARGGGHHRLPRSKKGAAATGASEGRRRGAQAAAGPRKAGGSSKLLCEDYGKGFVQRWRLIEHQAANSQALVPYPCHACGQQFQWMDELRAHAAMHARHQRALCTLSGLPR